ncbi:CHAT domain-containing protein [Actinoplanes sp. M2I2]|uniref:CHAT domain-containing protein n=1 Tax=Actinoplanes sp. M2I2 TaxID=1734444 RepID=UPI00201FC9A1|nr:CHAT domain-containing protein [Actinoplanes sp. M2I2]
MRSELIEFFRFGRNDTGMLRTDDRYLQARGNEPVREVHIPIDHGDFLAKIDNLRYAVEHDSDRRQESLDELAALVSEVLGPCAERGEPVQIDLVTNAAELSALPFELAEGPGRRPIFAVSEPPVVLTRRVRLGASGPRRLWWSHPRVLFAAASPAGAGDPVPLVAHRKALREALNPWSEPLPVPGMADPPRDVDRMLTVIERAGLSTIREAALAAVREGRPYTHLHVLAHGCEVGTRHKPAFGVALFDDDGKSVARVTPGQLREALRPIEPGFVVVTLAVCDGGNEQNSVSGGGSIAHELHGAGVPVVVASQFPLTFAGSRIFTESFYRRLLAGRDVRLALHDARSRLHQEGAETAHDWASMVGYVQLPEDYQDRLYEVAMKAEWASLHTAQRWSDRLVHEGITDPKAYDTVADLLGQRIESLTGYVEGEVAEPAVAARLENLGLLGSAQKRLAELAFRRARLAGSDRDAWLATAREELERARHWYQQGFTENLSHHWHGVQALSLEAALTGRIARVGQWYAAREAAELDDDLWRAASLAEVLLLSPMAGQQRTVAGAEEQLAELVRRVRAQTPEAPFPIDSTIRQLERYAGWWTTGHGYFPGAAGDLAEDAGQLLRRLRELAADH